MKLASGPLRSPNAMGRNAVPCPDDKKPWILEMEEMLSSKRNRSSKSTSRGLLTIVVCYKTEEVAWDLHPYSRFYGIKVRSPGSRERN